MQRILSAGLTSALLILLTAFLTAAHAATVEDLGSARVPVTDEGTPERSRAIAAAFAAVLVKIAGDSAHLGDARVAGLRRQAASFNTLFGYERGTDGALWLRADFDAARVATALREAGIAVWGRERPELTLRLVLRDAMHAPVAGTDETAVLLREAVAREAVQRGIPLQWSAQPFPAGTPGEASLAAPLLLDRLREVDEAPETRLDLVLEPDGATPPVWTVQWRLYVKDAPARPALAEGRAQRDLPETLLQAELGKAFDALARHYLTATAAPAAGEFQIRIEGVDSPEAWARTVHYLESLDVLTRVRVERVENGVLQVGLEAHGGEVAFAQATGFGQVLRAAPGERGRYTVLPR